MKSNKIRPDDWDIAPAGNDGDCVECGTTVKPGDRTILVRNRAGWIERMCEDCAKLQIGEE